MIDPEKLQPSRLIFEFRTKNTLFFLSKSCNKGKSEITTESFLVLEQLFSKDKASELHIELFNLLSIIHSAEICTRWVSAVHLLQYILILDFLY